MEGDAQNMETTISCAMRARIRDFKDQAHYLTLRRVRRSLEKDMGLKKFTLDAHKSFIKQCLHEELISGACRLLEGVEEQPVRPKKQAVKKVAARNTKGWKKRKRSTEERKPCSNQKNKLVKLAIEKGSNTDEGGNSLEEGKSQSSAEEPVKKKRETSTQVYGKRLEHLKSIIKACGMSIPPSVYKRAKQAPKNQREARLIKELEEILGKEGLSSNPFEKEIKEAKKRKERGKELADIDMSNIVSSSRRRSTSNFIIPPPKPRLAVEKNDGGGGSGDEEEDTDDEESESEGASEDIKDVKKQKKRAKLGIDMSNIVSSSHRKSTSNFIIPHPKSRLAIEKNDGFGGGDDDDEEEDTDDEESGSEGVCEEIKETKKRKERGKELADIDMSNIVSSSHRRSTSNFIIPPPKPRLAVEKNDGGGGSGDEEEDTNDEESESEGASEDIKDVKKQKKRAKLGIDMSNIVSSSHRKSTSNFIIPPLKSRFAIEKNDGVGGGGGDDDDEEDTDDEESESEGACEEIKETKKRKERGKELADIDMSNIVSSSHRRSTSNFIIPPPKPRLAAEKNDGGGGSGDEEEDTNDEESESEGVSEAIKDVKKQKKRAKLGIDMSNIVSSSHRKSTSNFINPPPKSRLAIEKNDGVGGGGNNDDDDEEDTDGEESESKVACEGILLHVGASSTSAQGSNTRKQVEFNQVGQPVGENAASFSTFVGQLTRTYCPIRYVDWRSIPAAVKDNIWSMIRDTYEIDVKYREKVLQKVNKSLRNWKWELRKHYDRFDQDAERKRNCPKGVKQEEWDSFVDVESMEQSISRRENGKASRKEMKRPHTTGRRGAARTAEKMQKENPNTAITRTDLYVATHTRSDGSYPTQELSATMEKIKSIIASDPASTQRDLDHDPVAQVCGRDSRGIIRGMGEGISKTTIMASIPYMEEAQTERRARMSVESRMEAAMAKMLKRLDEEKAFRMSVEQQLADIRQQIARQGQQAHCSPTQSHLRPTNNPVMPRVFKKTRSQLHKQKKFAI